MAQEASASLPQFYGERMPDGTAAERPNAPPDAQGNSDPAARHPIQPNPTHVYRNPENGMSPLSPIASSGSMAEGQARPRAAVDSNRWMVPLAASNVDRDEFEYRQNRRYPGSVSSHRPPYVEDYYEEEERPRVYRRPTRRHTRPPVTNNRMSGLNSRYSMDKGRASTDSYRGSYEYEEDTPIRSKYVYNYGSDEDHDIHPGAAYSGNGGGGRKKPPRGPPAPQEVLRLPWTMWMNSDAKNHFVAFVGEFVGTTMFLFCAFSGTQVANVESRDSSGTNTTTGADTGFSPQVLQYIALVFAFSLMVNVWIFFRISGGLFNPAVTFAMLLTNAMSLGRFFLLLVAQLAGAIFSSFLVSVMFPTPLNVRTTLSADTSLVRGVFIEAVLTAELVFTIFMLAKEKHKATFIAPIGIGLALFIAELVGVYYTGGSLNPARSFGPCVVTGVWDQEHWIYWLGPAIGAALAVLFYNFIKILEYEMANPDQDADDKDIKEKAAEEGEARQ